MNRWAIIAAGIIVLALAWYLVSPLFRTVEINDPYPNDGIVEEGFDSRTVAEGNFVPSAHSVEGRAVLIEQDGKKTLRFENFDTDNGPDLRIYLSADLDAEDFIDLGEIKATQGNVNYEIPSDVDIGKYSNVLVWCRAFSVRFSYAELQLTD